MAYRKTLIRILVTPMTLLFFIACDGGMETSEKEKKEVLRSASVFSQETTLVNFHNPDQVIAFDDKNRPLVSTDVNNCPPVEPDPTEPGPCDAGEERVGEVCLPICNENQNRVGNQCLAKCSEDEQLIGDQCLPICDDDQILAQGQCYDREKECPVENGQGSQIWMANSYGQCVAHTCDEGFELRDGQCLATCADDEVLYNGECKKLIADCELDGREGRMTWENGSYGECRIDRDCKVKNGQGIRRWIASKQKHGKCEPISCKPGYKKKKRKCRSMCKKDEFFDGETCRDREISCPIAGGRGEMTWDPEEHRYGSCELVACDRGLRRRGNSCVPWNRPPDGEADPLIVDLGSDIDNAQGIQLSSQIDGILFDILGENSTPNAHDKKQISWTNNIRYQWVVRPDSNGQVHGIDQMFGDNTLGPDNQFASDGFEALAKFDVDGNKKIDTDDPVFRELGLWADLNGNGQVDLGELNSLNDSKISYIDLRYDPNFFEVDQYGNKTSYKSIVSFSDGRKNLIFDMWFKYVDPDAPDELS